MCPGDVGSCPLCRLIAGDIRTRLYHRDSRCVVVDCDTCRIPMLVFAQHGDVSDSDVQHALRVISRLFGHAHLRTSPRKIKCHPHWHILNGRLVDNK